MTLHGRSYGQYVLQHPGAEGPIDVIYQPPHALFDRVRQPWEFARPRGWRAVEPRHTARVHVHVFQHQRVDTDIQIQRRPEALPVDVVFPANGKEIVKVPRSDVSPDGQIGFRVGAGVNLHASHWHGACSADTMAVSRGEVI